MTEAHGLAALYAVDALDEPERAAFEEHMRSCASCRREVDSLTEASAALAQSAAATPPESLRRSVLEAIQQTPQQPEEPEEATRPDDLHVARVSVPPARQTTGREGPGARSTRRRIPYAVAAAAVIVAGCMGGLAFHIHQQDDTADARVQQIARVISAPDAASSSGAVAGGGSATLVVSRRLHEALLITSALSRLPSDKTYEIWAIRKSAKPAGTFSPATSTTVVSLPQSVLASGAVAITVEPAGGSAHPTSKPVFSVRTPTGA